MLQLTRARLCRVSYNIVESDLKCKEKTRVDNEPGKPGHLASKLVEPENGA